LTLKGFSPWISITSAIVSNILAISLFFISYLVQNGSEYESDAKKDFVSQPD
jgi:hypothetical protein